MTFGCAPVIGPSNHGADSFAPHFCFMQIEDEVPWRTRRKPKSASVATTAALMINHNRISRIRTFVKKVESAIGAGDKAAAAEALAAAQPEIAKGVAKGVIHKNTASRKFSRLTKAVLSLANADLIQLGTVGKQTRRPQDRRVFLCAGVAR